MATWQEKLKVPLFLSLGHKSRLQKIDAYVFPPYLKEKVDQALGKTLTQEEYQYVELALRQFFKVWVLSSYGYVAMPSQGADALWHELILNTKEYHKFCTQVLGKFLHHTTNEAKPQNERSKEKAQVFRTWQLCCRAQSRDSADIYNGHALAYLFECDKKLGLYETGFIWFATNIDKERFLIHNPLLATQIKNLNLIEDLFETGKAA